MMIESLANEILFEIFDYLTDVDIFSLFDGLNHHFTELLIAYFRVSPHLNLQSITKTDFQRLCRYFLPNISNNIHSLRFSNNDDTPQQMEIFFSSSYSNLSQFSNLKLLSLDYMHSKQIIQRMMIEWQSLSNLTSLQITHCEILNQWNIVYSMINNIWSLPNLIHCHLDINVIGDTYSIIPTVISSSIQSLSIRNFNFNFQELIHLFVYTPNLSYLDIHVEEESNLESILFSYPLITTLILVYHGSFEMLSNLLKNLPNLSFLSIRIDNICVHGEQWEAIISNHLPKLQDFRLLLNIDRRHSQDLSSQLHTSYKTRFWLEEHQWYIHAHFYNVYRSWIFSLYTLPYTFSDYHMGDHDGTLASEWSLPGYHRQLMYDHVRYLSCASVPIHKGSLRYRFCNIHHLNLTLPIHENFWIMMPTFDQLQILDIVIKPTRGTDSDISFQLETLLEQAPRLYSLKITSSIYSLLPLLECPSKSIVKLHLSTNDEYFDENNCWTLILSLLGKQCEILLIKVQDRSNILQILREMPRIRTLNVEFPPDKYPLDDSSPNKDLLINWLQLQLPSDYIITRDSTYSNRIHLWIR